MTRAKRKFAIVSALLSAAFVLFGFGAPAEAAPLPRTSAVMPMGCGDLSMAAYGPIGGGWSRTYYGRCGHLDMHHNPYITVAWEAAPFTSSWACVRARGYRWSDGKAYWASLGCGTSGSGTVHWGKTGTQNIGTTAVQVKSQNIVLGVPVYFTD